MDKRLAIALVATGALLTAPSAARAQGALVHGSVAAAVSEGETSPSFGGGVAWRFNKALGFGVELSHVRSLASDFPRIYCCNDDDDMRVTAFTTNVRLEVPTTLARVVPFVVGGGGVAAVTQSFSVIYAANAQLTNDLRSLGLNTIPTILPGPSRVESTNTSMALTLGGGASFLITNRFAVDADLRVLHIMGYEPRNIGRYGIGVSYRF
jgi:opacity protein-like surface antigen